MSDSSDPRTAPGHALNTEAAPTAPIPVEAEPVFEPNSVNPDDYEWRPVARRPRADGWTPEVQQKFIAALADTGLVSLAKCSRL